MYISLFKGWGASKANPTGNIQEMKDCVDNGRIIK